MGDFVFGKIGTLGKPFFLTEPFEYCLSANLILIQPRSNVVLPEFLASFLNSPVLYSMLEKKKTNSTHSVFGIKKARLLVIPLPPLCEQHRILVKLEVLNKICDELKRRVNTQISLKLKLADSHLTASL